MQRSEMKEHDGQKAISSVLSTMISSAIQVGMPQLPKLWKIKKLQGLLGRPSLPNSFAEIGIFSDSDLYTKHLQECPICQDISLTLEPGPQGHVIPPAITKAQSSFWKHVIWSIVPIFFIISVALILIFGG